MSLNDKLINIQSTLKAPKGQFNSFGKYPYRSCEDILEAVKPLLKDNGLSLRIEDDVVCVGDRYYIKATAILSDGESEIKTTAFAREEANKKGMDSSQVTGATSSYARKYALNGLFAIDDNKDSDTTNTGNNTTNTAKNKGNTTAAKDSALTEETKKKINAGLLKYKEVSGLETKAILGTLRDTLGFSVDSISTESQGKVVVNTLAKMVKEKNKNAE